MFNLVSLFSEAQEAKQRVRNGESIEYVLEKDSVTFCERYVKEKSIPFGVAVKVTCDESGNLIMEEIQRAENEHTNI